MRISRQARQLAARAIARRGDALDELLDDELGDGLFSTLGGIAGTALFPGVGTAIGSMLGGLLDQPSEPPPSPAASPSPAAMAALLGGGGGAGDELPAVDAQRVLDAAKAARGAPSVDAIRSVVRDALSDHRSINGQADLDAAGRAQVTRLAAQRIVATLDPTTRKVRGALAVQRLQRQAGDEHARAKARAAGVRLSDQRHRELVALLERAERAFT